MFARVRRDRRNVLECVFETAAGEQALRHCTQAADVILPVAAPAHCRPVITKALDPVRLNCHHFKV